MRPKKRTITYLRAAFPPDMQPNTTLEGALRICLAARPNAEDTKCELSNGHAKVCHRETPANALCLHIASWTYGEAASTILHRDPAPDAELAAVPAGMDWDYLKADGMMLISGNHCLLMPSGLLPKTMEHYLHLLLRHSEGVADAVLTFQLLPIANPALIQQVLQDGGVRKVDLNIGRYFETARVEEEDQRTRVKRIGYDVIAALVADEETRQEIEDAENLTAKLVISVNSRQRGITADKLRQITEPILAESADDIEIETRKGQRIRRGDLILRTTVNVRASDSTVDHSHAWQLLGEYFSELSENGMLEE